MTSTSASAPSRLRLLLPGAAIAGLLAVLALALPRASADALAAPAAVPQYAGHGGAVAGRVVWWASA